MSVIVNPRGTSGSGKSTLVRAVMALYGSKRDVFVDGRRRPLYTVHERSGFKSSDLSRRGRNLMVLGHYEAACGGCDTITQQDRIFELVRLGIQNDWDVLFEGLILSGEIRQTTELAAFHPLNAIALTTPVEQCVANINKRREARGQMEPVRPKNTVAKARCVELTMARLDGVEGFNGTWANYDDALTLTRSLLDV